MQKIRIVIAEDHHLIRKAVASLLENEPDIEVIGEVAETTTLPDVVAKLEPHLLLLDANMPGPNTIETAKRIRVQHPELKILVLSAYDRPEHVVGLLRAGASGYILKDDEPRTLIHAIHKVINGEEWLTPRVAGTLLTSLRNEDNDRPADLTKREKDVMRIMVTGAGNEEIAEALFITVSTVKNHVQNIFRKLNVETRVEAVVYAMQHDLVQSEEID